MAEKHPKKPNDAKALARWNNEGGAPATGDVSTRKLPKRARDVNAWAKQMVDLATGQVEDRDQASEARGKDPAAVARGRKGGAKGGKARAATLSPEERLASAKKAAEARLKGR